MISNHWESWLLLQPLIFLFPQTPPSFLLTRPLAGYRAKFAFLPESSRLRISLPAPAARSPTPVSCQLPVICPQAIVFGGGSLAAFVLAAVAQ